MKVSFILVFSAILLVYAGINTYILIRGWQAMEFLGSFRRLFIGVVALLPALFIAMFFMRRIFDNVLIDAGWTIGSEWVAMMLYFLIAVIALDLLRFVLWAVGKSPVVLFGEHYRTVKFVLFLSVNIIVVVLLFIGHYKATAPRISKVDINIEKEASGYDSLNVVLISDLHLGAINGYNTLQRWVTAVNKLSPDMVLIAGDIVDDSPGPLKRKHLGELLAEINAPLGVYCIQGNHELYGNFPRTLQYLQTHGISFLLDTAMLVDNSFYVVGRLDRQAGRGVPVSGKHRKTLEELLLGLDHNKPIILLDHQPYELGKTAAAGVDLQVSGHTHRGQMWPLTLITKRVYELDYGYLRKGNTHFYVTEGLGTWGPRVRIGSRSEIVQLKIKFRFEE